MNITSHKRKSRFAELKRTSQEMQDALQAIVDEGLDTSDAQGIADMEFEGIKAAAPDLLSALENLADYVFAFEGKQNICTSVWMDAREAIAKAKGEA